VRECVQVGNLLVGTKPTDAPDSVMVSVPRCVFQYSPFRLNLAVLF
jgi:hypothetical protein